MRHHLRSIGTDVDRGPGDASMVRLPDSLARTQVIRAGTSTSRRPRLLFGALEETISSSVDEGNEEAKGG